MKTITLKGIKHKLDFKSYLHGIACNYFSVAVYQLDDSRYLLQKEKGGERVWGHYAIISKEDLSLLLNSENEYQTVLNTLEFLEPAKQYK